MSPTLANCYSCSHCKLQPMQEAMATNTAPVEPTWTLFMSCLRHMLVNEVGQCHQLCPPPISQVVLTNLHRHSPEASNLTKYSTLGLTKLLCSARLDTCQGRALQKWHISATTMHAGHDHSRIKVVIRSSDTCCKHICHPKQADQQQGWIVVVHAETGAVSCYQSHILPTSDPSSHHLVRQLPSVQDLSDL